MSSSLREPKRRGTNASSMAAPPTAASVRAGTAGRAGVRQTKRVSTIRYQSHLPPTSRLDRSRAASPAESLMSVATSATSGTKRKERDFESDPSEETNINVVVRCRGRNDREVRENSAVVVLTEGVKGKNVELSMGPNALGNKTYNFDHVFSPAADQGMIFDDVVKPILDEMLAGYNCTIFAYGQTGTGKTYTMSGDMSESLGYLTEAAGIIPRVLQSLFHNLDSEEIESSVKCSFIELYNEDLRDLLSPDDSAKLKIFDDTSKKSHATTVVQGMEERHITSAGEGIKRLQEGSLRRQVAATKCNDLSSRSHTVFTITVHTKRSGEDGEDYLCAGKLNLVDLAGSENIQRSGAENKRAAEAGLINKSLLTLGRVINALVDKSSHIPYRESKLTRLLQDSLGGRTKTCIIATVSPAKSNLEETISTLDYAFRAKNIRNKPQVNQLINKKTLLREYTAEIEKLKSELIATRQRNGVYLSNEAYEEMTVQSESRRILAEEQGAKLGMMENNLRKKVQELFDLTSSFMGLEKDHETTKAQLDETKEVLDQTELVLNATRKTLAEETHLRKAHQETEEKLATVGGELLSTLKTTVGHVGGLHAKNKRKSDIQSLNRSTWAMSQSQVSDVTELVEGRIEELRKTQDVHISSISEKMKSFVEEEVEKLSSTQAFLDQNLARFADSKRDLLEQQSKSKEEMDDVLEEIKTVRDNIKNRVGDSLQAIASAAERIAEDVLSELNTFHGQLHSSYSSLGKDFKSIFEDLLKHITSQRSEAGGLRKQIAEAGQMVVQSNALAASQIEQVVREERKQAAADRMKLLAQITTLVNSQAAAQDERLTAKANYIKSSVADSGKALDTGVQRYSSGMKTWDAREAQFYENATRHRDVLKTKLKVDWTSANDHSTSIQNTTKSVHAETVRVVDEQLRDLDVQMRDLDDFVTRARSENASHQAQQTSAVNSLSTTVESSLSNISDHFTKTFDRVKDLGEDMDTETNGLRQQLEPVVQGMCQPLSHLREDINNTVLREYEPTGETPEKRQYRYPTDLPKTDAHEVLIARLEGAPTPSKPPPAVFNDFDSSDRARSPSRPPSSRPASSDTDGASSIKNPLSMSLREMNANLTTGSIMFDPSASMMSLAGGGGGGHGGDNTMPMFRRSTRLPQKHAKGKNVVAMEGRENVPPSAFSQSSSRRKSPRLR